MSELWSAPRATHELHTLSRKNTEPSDQRDHVVHSDQGESLTVRMEHERHVWIPHERQTSIWIREVLESQMGLQASIIKHHQ